MSDMKPISAGNAFDVTSLEQTKIDEAIFGAKSPVIYVCESSAEKLAKDATNFLNAFYGVRIIFDTDRSEKLFHETAHPRDDYYANFRILREELHQDYALRHADYIVFFGCLSDEKMADIRERTGPQTIIGQGGIDFQTVIAAKENQAQGNYPSQNRCSIV